MEKLVGIIVGATLLLASAAFAASAPVTLCHRPPGNPSHAFAITVGRAAVAAHLAHGDNLVLTCDDIDECGLQDDGCGGTLDCGSCCLTCIAGVNCGGFDDGCGNFIECGQCLNNDKCVFNLCDTVH